MTCAVPRGIRTGAALTVGTLLFSIAGDAHANGATGLGGLAVIFTAFCAVVAVVALGLSLLLAAAGWITAARGPSSVGSVFGRGFLGVSAVLCFGIGIFALSAALNLFSVETSGALLPVLVVAVLVFLAIEFVIGATLYGRVHARSPSSSAQLLSFVSYGIAGVLVLAALSTGVFALVGETSTDPASARRSEQTAAELRGYDARCLAGSEPECEVLELFRELVPREDAAAEAFRQGCDRDIAPACLSAAKYYAANPALATAEQSEAAYRSRYDELAGNAGP